MFFQVVNAVSQVVHNKHLGLNLLRLSADSDLQVLILLLGQSTFATHCHKIFLLLLQILLYIFSGQALEWLTVQGDLPKFVTFSLKGVRFCRIAFVVMRVYEHQGYFKI